METGGNTGGSGSGGGGIDISSTGTSNLGTMIEPNEDSMGAGGSGAGNSRSLPLKPNLLDAGEDAGEEILASTPTSPTFESGLQTEAADKQEAMGDMSELRATDLQIDDDG